MKSFLRRHAVAVLRSALRCGGERWHRIVTEALSPGDEHLYQVIERVPTSRGDVTFYCLGDTARWRALSLLTKEPETIEWIDSFSDGDTFWDVGANVGVYSLYAAINRRIRVLAFEPSAANYFLLNRNIELNKLDGIVQGLCVAFSDDDRIDALNMLSTGLGGALSSFGEPIDPFGKTFSARFRQGAIGFSIDAFIDHFRPTFPNHLKIDVDGIEDRIIAGAQRTLADGRLKSLSIELDSGRVEYTNSVVARVERAGLLLMARRHSDMIESGEYKSIFNYQFRRNE
ncbi:MAG TPA: FkbM family methyltransferase [Stellaceae bacterium]|nr:FkbM family methyltransferase [Stellaceae bacterium]